MGDESMRVTLIYEPCVAGGPRGQFGSECWPLRLDAYGTHELGACGVETTIFREETKSVTALVTLTRSRRASKRGGRYRGPFEKAGAYKLESIEQTSTFTMAASTALVVNAYATTWSHSGERCWTQVGTAVVLMSQLISLSSGTLVTQFVQNHDNDASVQQTRPLLKGSLHIAQAQVGATLRVLRAATALDVDCNAKTQRNTASEMCALINRGMDAYFARNGSATLARPTKKFLYPFHCPEYRTPRMPVASSAYAMLEVSDRLDVAYYEQLLDIALARGALRRDMVAELAAAPPDSYQGAALVSLAVRTVTVFATSQVYLSDFFNRNVSTAPYRADLLEEDEDFKVCRLCGGDDCEGCALEVMMHVRELCGARRSDVKRMSAELRAVRALLSEYVPLLTLGCVTNERMTAATLDQSVALAHTFCTLMPRAALLDALAANVRNDAVQTLNDYTLDAKSRGRPVVIAEGTAPIDPAMRPVETYYARPADAAALQSALAAAYARRDVTLRVEMVLEEHGAEVLEKRLGAESSDHSAEAIAIEVFGPPDRAAPGVDYSTFYKWIVSFATPALGAMRVFDWALVYDRDNARKRSFGVTANDFLAGAESVGVVPFLKYTEAEAELSDAVLADQQPIPALRTAASNTCSLCPRRAAYEERLAALQNFYAEPVDGDRGTVLHPRQTFMTVRERDVGDNLLKALAKIVDEIPLLELEYKWYTLNRAVDGTDEHNCILDIYLRF